MRPPDSELILSFVSNDAINLESVYIYAWYKDMSQVVWVGNWYEKKIVYIIYYNHLYETFITIYYF